MVKKNLLPALLSAFLLWLAWPPMPFTAPLLLIGFVPLLFAVENIFQSGIQKRGRAVFIVCGITFFVWNTSCIYWVFNSLNAIMPVWVASLISLIPFGLAALLMTVAFCLYYKLRKITNRSLSYAGLVCFWMGYEYLHQTWDLAFPWMNLGNGFAAMHQLIQWYEFTGVYGGTYWILVSNILIFETYLAFKVFAEAKPASDNRFIRWWQSRNALAGRSALHIFIPVAISLIIYYRYEERPNPAHVVVVQPNIDPYAKYSIPVSAQLKNMFRLSDSIGRKNTEYFIWPETAIAEFADEQTINTNPNFLSVQQFLAPYKNANVISGIESYALYDSAKTPTAVYREQINKYSDSFNAAIQIENSAKVQFYHKSKLVPGVEQLPFSSALAFMKPIFAGFGGSTGGYGKQDEPTVLYSQTGIGAAPVICYESIWGEYVADYIVKGAQFIAVITNDAWWGNTSGKDQHLAYAKLRAIETRRWVARSANTGISAFINQRGDVVQQTEWWVPTALSADINLNSELTFYVKYQDYVALAGCVGCGVFGMMLLLTAINKRNHRRLVKF